MLSPHVQRLLVATAATVAALAAPAVASAHANDQRMLRQYQPVTVFDPAEQFRPTSVRFFVADSVLERFDNGAWVTADAHPETDELPTTGTFRLNQASCSPVAAIGGLACYAAAAQRANGRSTVYGRVVHTADATVLQYWYFYYDDVYSYFYPPSDLIWQAHEGDWEVVNVVLSETRQPLEVGYSQHCLGQTRSWEAAPRFADTHPLVYVAAGSHANYFSPGLHAFDARCVPPPALALLTQHGLPLPVDYAGVGDIAGPVGAGGQVTQIQRLDDDDDENVDGWLAFPGTWGELQYFHSPFTGSVPLGTSPTGPAFHTVWSDPIGTLATWSAG